MLLDTLHGHRFFYLPIFTVAVTLMLAQHRAMFVRFLRYGYLCESWLYRTVASTFLHASIDTMTGIPDLGTF